MRLLLVAAALALAPSPDPYTASLQYAQCLRAHGVPHPLPDAKGDFSLTAADEARLRASELLHGPGLQSGPQDRLVLLAMFLPPD